LLDEEGGEVSEQRKKGRGSYAPRLPYRDPSLVPTSLSAEAAVGKEGARGRRLSPAIVLAQSLSCSAGRVERITSTSISNTRPALALPTAFLTLPLSPTSSSPSTSRTSPRPRRSMPTLCCVCGVEAALRCPPCAKQGFDIAFCGAEHQKLVSISPLKHRKPPRLRIDNADTPRYAPYRSGSLTRRSAARTPCHWRSRC
jgi:hypothetical protein